MQRLQIHDPYERAMVRTADAAFATARALTHPFRRRVPPLAPRRILLLRMERIGDLLMALPAIADIRAAAPQADIDLVVGSWNRGVAASIPAVTRVLTLDAAWLAREGSGLGPGPLLREAIRWRARHYDLAVNFEPDVRTNLLLAACGARWTAGYRSAGGGALLDRALDYEATAHTTENARRLAAAVLPVPRAARTERLLVPSEAHRRHAEALLRGHRRTVAMHVPGGRDIKQWPPDRFAAVARALIEQRGVTIALTGSAADRPVVNAVLASLPPSSVADASGAADLMTTAALIEACELMITGDTGPMHIAAAVGTPVVAVFGPSDPRRYAPSGPHDRIVRVDLPCAPCNRIRLPPARCTGRTPDCLALIAPDRVLGAALAVLDECGGIRRTGLA